MATQIKSKERVRDLAEVYTNEREVNAMLDLIPLPKPNDILTYKYLEPACGNGNFLIEILRRKLRRVNELYAEKGRAQFEFNVIRCLTTIYGIDICPQNVEESRLRLFIDVKSNYDLNLGSYIYSDGFLESVDYVLRTNIVAGDSINKPEYIFFTEFKAKRRAFSQHLYCFADLSEPKPTAVRNLPETHYLRLADHSSAHDREQYERKQRHFEFV